MDFGSRLIAALLRNAIPFYGVLVLGWTPGTLVLLFVIEVVLGSVAISLRIRAHEHASRDPRHRDPAAYRDLPGITMDTLRGVFWRDYFEFVFTRAVILGIMAYAFPLLFTLKFVEQRVLLLPDWYGLALGTAAVLAVHVGAWLRDAGRIGRVPFTSLHQAARAGYAQVLLLCALVMGGSFGVLTVEDMRFLGYTLIGLKLAADLADAVVRRV